MRQSTIDRNITIRDRAAAGFTAQQLAEHYGLSVLSIRRILNSPRQSDRSRHIAIGKRTWQQVKELSLAAGCPPHVFMGRVVREALQRGL